MAHAWWLTPDADYADRSLNHGDADVFRACFQALAGAQADRARYSGMGLANVYGFVLASPEEYWGPSWYNINGNNRYVLPLDATICPVLLLPCCCCC